MEHLDFNYPTECWRYEYLDGGGPWFYPDGKPRVSNLPAFENNDGILCGCDTITNLNKYMTERNIDTSQMCLAHYLDIEVVRYNPNNGHISFRKKD